MVVLRPIGDMELWYAEPPDRNWRLPLHVEWKEHTETGAIYGLVLPAVYFYPAQMLNMQSMLAGFTVEEEGKRWLIPEGILRALLVKAPGLHASYYYRWPGGKHPPLPLNFYPMSVRLSSPERRRLSEQHTDFAAYLSKERHLPQEVVQVVLTAVSQVGARWMLEHRMPIDFGFVKLVALPFRMNWKEVVEFKFRGKGLRAMLNLPRRERAEVLHEHGFEAAVCNLHNIGIKRGLPSEQGNTRLDYTIEAITSDKFDETVTTVEAERMTAGSANYVAQFEAAVEHHYEIILDALARYLNKAAAPWAKVLSSGVGGFLKFVSVGGRPPKVRGHSLKELPAHLVAPDSGFCINETESDPLLIPEQAAALPEVPAVPPPAHDVRQRKVRIRPAPTAGLPVRHEQEGAVPRKPVLFSCSPSTGDSSRMDPQ